MKIGILTFHMPCNFGANLQAYSSTQYFESLGHEVHVLNYIRQSDLDYKSRVNELQLNAHRQFVEKNLPITNEVSTVSELRSLVKSYLFDLIVVGADAVWRVLPQKDQIFFMNWLFEDPDISCIPVISMSAAHMGIGFEHLSPQMKNYLKDGLDKFRYLSVRDSWTKNLINKQLFGYEKVSVLNPDPVFLLDSYISKMQLLFPNGLEKNKYYLMTLPNGWLDTHKEKRMKWYNKFKEIVNSAGYLLVELPLPEGTSGLEFDYVVPYPIDPFQWFLWIKNAKAFCGLRFHSIVSSISVGTPFYSIDTYGNSSRVLSVLSRLGFYRFVRLFDFNSKIRNLLYHTNFEENRISKHIENISPLLLYKILDGANISMIHNLCEQNRRLFDMNMKKMLSLIQNND